MIPESTASDVSLCYIKMGMKYESKREIFHADECFRHAVDKADQALENHDVKYPSIGLTAYFEYARFLYRQRRYIDAFDAVQKAKNRPCPYSHEVSLIKQDMLRMEDEIRTIVKTRLGV